MSAPIADRQQETLNALLKEATGTGDLAHIKLYVSKGADVHMSVGSVAERVYYPSNNSGWGTAPLYHYMLAAQFNKAVSDFLLEQGVDVDVKNHNGNTPLMLAVMTGDLGRVNYFLSKGADPLATNNAGDMVLDIARRLPGNDVRDRQAIIDALLSPLPDRKTQFSQAAAPGGAGAVDAVSTTQKVVVSKPLQISPRPKSQGGADDGFKL